MQVDYNSYAETFSQSRKNLKWPEIDYFLSHMQSEEGIVDIACGNGRLITAYTQYFGVPPKYYSGVDLSKNLLQEASTTHPGYAFLPGDMQDPKSYSPLTQAFGDIKKSLFCIAGLHHITSIDERQAVLRYWFDFLKPGERVYMTNWALESQYNKNMYKNAMIPQSENQFEAHDFSIKIGKYYRWYHSFTLKELEFLAQSSGFHILENRLFSTEKNFITILSKPLGKTTRSTSMR